MIAIIFWMMAVLPFMSPGCKDDKMNVGYYSIDIPGYEEADYLNMLNSPNDEMQYNAICELTMNKDYDKVLTTDSLKGTAKYDSALLVYKKIVPFMQSQNSWVSSAAIRFISSFEYNRQEFLDFVLKYNDPSLNVQLEIMMDIMDDTTKNQNLLTQKISFLQQQPSWLLQNGSFLIMGATDSLSAEQLINTYSESKDEYRKLLILEVFISHMTDTVFHFLANEWATTKNERIKKIIFQSLPNAKNHQLVLDWFTKHIDLLNAGMKETINNLTDREINGKLITVALEHGWKPASLPTKSTSPEYDGKPLLYVNLFENKYAEYATDSVKIKLTAAGKLVEEALFKDPLLKSEWLAYEKKMLKYPLPQEFIKMHQLITDAYLKQSAEMFQQYKIDTALSNDFLKETDSRTKQLYKEKIRLKE
jgi:hypothetical protein